jgi:hypothetical protein
MIGSNLLLMEFLIKVRVRGTIRELEFYRVISLSWRYYPGFYFRSIVAIIYSDGTLRILSC